jgi:CBS domain-containing protein
MLVEHVLQSKLRQVVVIGTDRTVQDAVKLLVEHNIGSLPVVDSTARIVGIFTERDVLRGVAGDCERFAASRVGDVMTSKPLCCAPGDEVHAVMGVMSEHAVGQLPVVDAAGRVVAVVSVGDLIKVLHQRAESENRQLLAYIHGGA